MEAIDTQNTQKPATQPSPYLSFYGLAREPFAHAIEFDLFYPEPNRVQQLDILHHLTQYGNELLLVTGPGGSGKSSLLQQFAASASDTWEVARIEAKGGIDERNLMQQFYRQLELNFRGATHPELLDQLQHHLDSLLHNARQGVLLVDDAHQLTVTALQRILQLATLRNFTDKPLLRVILFGEPELDKKFDDPLLAPHSSAPRRVIALSPFSEEESTHYILHRLSAARFVASEPFTEGVLHKIYKQSEGWPGRINSLAHQRLLDSLPKTEYPPELPGISDKALYKPRRMVAIGIITALFLVFILWDTLGNLFAPAPHTATTVTASREPAPASNGREQTREQQDLAIPARPTPTEPVPTEKVLAAQNPPRKETASTVQHDHQPHPLGGKPVPAIASTPIKPTTGKAPAIGSAKKIATPATPPATAAEVKPPAPKPVKTPKLAATDTPVNKQWQPLPDWLPSRRHDWLLSRNPQHFTLQVVAGERLETLQKFITHHKLDKQIAFYQSTRQGKPWYALVYGDYPNKQAAIDARSQLPRKLRRLKPWIRGISDIQKSLK